MSGTTKNEISEDWLAYFLLEEICFGLRSHGPADFIAFREQTIEYVRANKAVGAGEEDERL
jgi:hypothetical protein